MKLWQKILQKYPKISELEISVFQMKYPLTYFYHLFMKLSKKRIHVIGDSHVSPFVMKYPFVIHHCGAATAHNLLSNSSKVKAWLRIIPVLDEVYKNGKEDILLFTFGEIDARIHIYDKFVKTKESIGKLCMDTVQRYGELLKNLNEVGYKVFVLGIAPASRVEKNHFNYQNYGTPEHRRVISLTFNTTLKNYCKKNNLKFIDLYKFADDEGFIKYGYNGDGIHLNSKIVPYVKEKICNSVT